MHIFTGSTNPVKINAVVSAASETWPEVQVTGVDVSSGVSDQPRSDQETERGAINRAKAALETGLFNITQSSQESDATTSVPFSSENTYLGIGLEGGVFTRCREETGFYGVKQWQNDNQDEKNIKKGGQKSQNSKLDDSNENITKQTQLWSTVWAAVVDQEGNVFTSNGARCQVPEPVASFIRNGQEMGPVVAKITGKTDVRKKQGMVGIITQGFVDRTEEYAAIAKFALGLWYGRNWHQKLHN